MSDRHDLRRQTREIREALSRFSPEQLVDILTHIFRQYVMEGAAAPASSVTLADELQGLSFAQVVERLQLRLDLPELRLLEVAGGRVSCRVEGRLVPLEVPDARAPEPLPVMRGPAIQQIQLSVQPPASAPPASAAAAPAAAPGTESREISGAAPPGVAPVGHAGSARPDGTARPSPPRPGAVTARSAAPAASAAAGGPARPSSAPAASAQGGPAAPAPARPEKPAPPEKPDNGGRFNLLEID